MKILVRNTGTEARWFSASNNDEAFAISLGAGQSVEAEVTQWMLGGLVEHLPEGWEITKPKPE